MARGRHSDPDGIDSTDDTGAEDTGGGPGTKMLRNSLFLMASAGLTAGIGFIFWALVAHLYSSTQIGLATTLLSAISLISFLSTFGFGATMIRFPARGAARHRQVSMMLALVAAASFVLGTGYVLAVRMISPDLAFVRDKPVYALVLIVICVFATVNLVTDSVFMAARRAEYNTLVDGFIQSVAKLAIPVFVVGMGAMGIVAASGTGYVVATLASLYFMYRKLDFRFSFRLGGTRIRETAGYSATTQFSSLLNLIPQLALPIITLRWLGPDDVTYYYLGSQVAALLSTGSYAIGDALFSEGAHDPEQLRSLMKRSAAIMTAVMVPGVAAVILVREPLLSLFGSKYPGHAQGLLTILALGALAVAFHTWASSALRITGRMTALLGSNLVYLVATLALALGFAHRGLNWIGWAWALGNLASGLFAVAFVPGAKMAALDEAGEDRGPSERPEPEQDFARVAVGDSTAITEPMFFPWNRPEARGRSDRFEAYGSDGDDYAPPQLYGRESWQPVGAGGLRVRPRWIPRQARPAVPRPSSEPEPEPEPTIVRPINVPESFFRPEPEEDRDPRPEPPVDDASGDGPWRPPRQ
ncbi:lipopolysaccharide biosynthesis protein [Catenulispora sp. NF23]|uniref:lipopolysaccharide biosynthesis protein n=1 Tax=Catenulispora pinistramenti TaxID=2705254 RepID=UPI001BA7615E|nr:lipopolysaccharide biosynthesis protein [Catenulispora pinistramenti]MBS2532689.1 lipopolysaccharide biosynthesis protein [Catenulispora pinistramenti]